MSAGGPGGGAEAAGDSHVRPGQRGRLHQPAALHPVSAEGIDDNA